MLAYTERSKLRMTSEPASMMKYWKWLWMVLVALRLLEGWCDGCLEHEKIALLQLKPFFHHFQGLPYWVEWEDQEISRINYSTSDCCEWEWVQCNSNRRVIRLFLNQSIFTHTWDDLVYEDYYPRNDWYLNASLFFPFEELKSLYLSGNSIAGCVHNGGFETLSSKLNKLEILDLNANYLNDSIFSSLSELSSLKSLYLGYNRFTESNHTNVGIKKLSKLNNLETLDLHDNSFGNNIVSHLHGFTSLKTLHLQNCGLNGTLHMQEFSNLTNLKELYLGENKIENLKFFQDHKGELRLDKLEVLGLSSNLFNNSIFSSLGALSNLKLLYIGCNKLKGPLDIKALNALSNLEELYMWDNEVTNFVSSQDKGELKLDKLEVLVLSYNLFNNSIFSSLGALLNLKSLLIGNNKLKGPLDIKALNASSNLEELYMRDNEVTDFVSSQEIRLINLKELNLLGNLFNNNILSFVAGLPNLKFLFIELKGSMDIRELNGLNKLEKMSIGCSYGLNSTSGGGVELETTACSLALQSLPLFPSLKTLRLTGFNFNGTIATQKIHNFTNLEELYLDGSLLQTNFLGSIGEFTSLKRLTLYECGINFGSITPQGFCELSHLHLQLLDISYNNLKGNLPQCFSNFTTLEGLDLSSNQFSGDISALEHLTSLQALSLSNNNFEIPSSLRPLFNLSNLWSFHADNNTIYPETEMHSLAPPTFQPEDISLSCCGDGGSFPQFFYHQQDLRYVDLSNIYFKGEFPNWLLENNTKLRTLYLANNSLHGHFELPFLSHTDLSFLDISKNYLYGHIPDEIGAKLPSLKFLNMSKNYFHGSIPASIGDMKSLYDLDMSNNKLSGRLPEHLAMSCSSLSSLILSNNRLQGLMFSSNFSLTDLRELQLDGNYFSGKIPDCLAKCSFLSTLDVSSNQLVGGIPSWLGNMSSLSTLDLSHNKLFGEIPRWMGNMSSLEEIVMANNHLEGPIPMEFCQLNLNLKLLDLSVNNISGSLPSCFSPLWISQVHLSRNKLQGPLNNAFRNSTILVTLDLSNNHFTGNIATWIGRLSQLSLLLLNNNHFEGGIPVQLCKLGHLSLIDLSHNNLSGTIPPCLKITTLNDISQDYVRYVAAVAQAPSSFSTDEPIQFTAKNNSYSYKGRVLSYLSGIDLSCNKLTGQIPHEVLNFQKIIVLNLSHNCLTGPIPPTLSNLRQIESLDLSYNNLSGKIPRQLVGLNYLSFFSVAFNNLSGTIPQSTAQFATFGESSYQGNPLLCGAPLPKNCSADGTSSSMPKASTENGSIDINVFYVTFVVTYVVVLLGIACVLYINPYWRRAWFYHVEAITTSCYYFVMDHLPKPLRWGNM